MKNNIYYMILFLFYQTLQFKYSKFHDIKFEIIKFAQKNRLANYLRERLILEHNLDKKGVIYLDTVENIRKLSKLNEYTILDSNKNTHQIDINNIIARIYTKIFFDKKNVPFSKLVVRSDHTEVFKNWKFYLVLVNDKVINKLVKVCFLSGRVNIGIVLENFNEKCNDVILEIQKYNILRDQDNESKLQVVKNLRNSILSRKLKYNLSKSFLEISKNETIDLNDKNSFSVEDLAQKFSFDDLIHLKSLIYFAKINKIDSKIYEKRGNITIKELINQNDEFKNYNQSIVKLEKNIFDFKKHFTDFFENSIFKFISKTFRDIRDENNVHLNKLDNKFENMTKVFNRNQKETNRLIKSILKSNYTFQNNPILEQDDLIEE